MDTTTVDKQTLETVLPYWFGDIAEDRAFDRDSIQMQRWYGKSRDIDAEIRSTFLDLYEALRITADAALVQSLSFDKRVAAIIVLDQFPRNMFRDTPRMYESDDIALEQARLLSKAPEFDRLDLFKKMFVLLPFMHAEDLDSQDFMLSHFQQFPKQVRDRGLPNAEFFDEAQQFAERHREIIARFNRFPHRNSILGRETTAEEREFLKEPNSSF